MFIDDDAAKFARRRRCHCLREDGPMFGLTPGEEGELARLNKEFPEDLNQEFQCSTCDDTGVSRKHHESCPDCERDQHASG